MLGNGAGRGWPSLYCGLYCGPWVYVGTVTRPPPSWPLQALVGAVLPLPSHCCSFVPCWRCPLPSRPRSSLPGAWSCPCGNWFLMLVQGRSPDPSSPSLPSGWETEAGKRHSWCLKPPSPCRAGPVSWETLLPASCPCPLCHPGQALQGVPAQYPGNSSWLVTRTTSLTHLLALLGPFRLCWPPSILELLGLRALVQAGHLSSSLWKWKCLGSGRCWLPALEGGWGSCPQLELACSVAAVFWLGLFNFCRKALGPCSCIRGPMCTMLEPQC